MLNRICNEDGVGLVNVVRRPEQAELLRSEGARHVVDASAGDLDAALTEAIAATGATIAFDAVGGGDLASRILAAMEAAALRKSTAYSRYGTTTPKQVYIYGGLDMGPTTLSRSWGMTWKLGGWLLWPFMQSAGPETVARLKVRVAAGLKTTFASRYARELTLAQAIDPEEISRYAGRGTGEKALITPQR
jgi:hypothetical protein